MVRLSSAVVAAVVMAIGFAVAPSMATFQGENGRISFSRNVGSHVEIYSANPDGSDVTQLTASTPRGAASVVSDWSPNGEVIAFDSDRTDIDGRGAPIQIYLMAADGSDETQLTRGPGFHGNPGWSPDGSSLAIDSDWGERSLNGIWIIPASDPDGVTVDDARRVTTVPKGFFFDSEPQFTPDGTTIVFTRFKSAKRSAIFRVNVDGTGLERLTSYRLNASRPDVSPDGRWIAFDSGDKGRPGSKGNIFVMPVEGGRKNVLTDNPRLEEGEPFTVANNPSFSPNGRKIVYTQFGEGGSDLVVMKVNGSGKHVILGGGRFPNKADWGAHP